MIELKDNGRMTLRLAGLPYLELNEYHEKQIALYTKLTELTYRAFTLSSINKFLNELIVTLGINEVEVRIMRFPSHKSKIYGVNKKGRIIEQQLYGRSWKKKPLIDIFPHCLYPDKTTNPVWYIGMRGEILNTSVRAVFHEVLHQSGFSNECEIRRITHFYYKEFRKRHIQAFNKEIKPLVREWKAFEKQTITAKQ